MLFGTLGFWCEKIYLRKKKRGPPQLVARTRLSCSSNCYLNFQELQRDRKVRLGVETSLLCLRMLAKLNVTWHVVSGRNAKRRESQSSSFSKPVPSYWTTFLPLLIPQDHRCNHYLSPAKLGTVSRLLTGANLLRSFRKCL